MLIRKLLQQTVACVALSTLLAGTLSAAECRGVVKFGGLPIPGATVTASKDGKAFIAITNELGNYAFPDLADGAWNVQVEMQGFTALKQEVAVAAQAPPSEFELKMMPFAEIAANAPPPPPPSAKPAATTTAASNTPAGDAKTEAAPADPKLLPKADPKNAKKENARNKGKQAPAPAATGANAFRRADLNASTTAPGAAPAAAPAEGSSSAPANDPFAGQSQSELNSRAADGLLINGSVNNSASSPFALGAAFGNNRRGLRSLYNGNLSYVIDHSSLDARPFSITGQDTQRPSFSRSQYAVSFGGPLKIPKLLPRGGPNFFFGYQRVQNRNANTQSVLVPTEQQRLGNFAGVTNQLGQPIQIFDPLNGQPFSGNVIPSDRISAQARALVKLYPSANFSSSRFNYQVPLVDHLHSDSLQVRLNRSIGRMNSVNGSFAIQNTRTDNPNIFGFLDTGRSQGMNSSVAWRHSFSPRLFGTLTYTFSRSSSRNVPFFADRENVSGAAGITGNNQEPINWGPPGLNFSAGIAPLNDGNPSRVTNQTNSLGLSMFNSRGRHGLTYGGDYRRLQFNNIAQQNPRGTFTFTGASTQSAAVPGSGSDFAGFLLGVPDTSAIAFGNADKYYRSSSYAAFLTDDWRLRPGLTLNIGIRWEYNSPITELYGRLVNLDVTPGFRSIAPVVANQPTGSLTGLRYDDSLIAPDRNAFQPRIALSWRPLPASSMVIRAGYGVYSDTSVYQAIAARMAQQSPLSKNLNISNTAANPLTLANGFTAPPNLTTNTFAVDPQLRVGYAQTWQASIQRDLPYSLVMVATYLGTKGTRAMQQFLPNTFPNGAVNPCPACPSGFTYLTSNGNSTRHAGTFQLRRRLHAGFAASMQYTYAKAIDNASLGGRNAGAGFIAQDWLSLDSERSRSTFDQRHLVSVDAQYSTGMGLRGGALMGGWRGKVLKGWTVTSRANIGTGLPLSPVFFAAVRGTGVTGTARPDYTGASIYDAPAGLFLNPAAYSIPVGHWGNAGRNTITGPNQFTLNASASRTFRSSDRISIDLRVDATNVLNNVTYPNYNTTVQSAQFGLPNFANPMRSIQTTVRARF